MVKVVFCVRKRPEMSDEEFHRYWLEEHGPLVRSVANALGIVRYVQTHKIDTPANEAMRVSRGAAEPYDGAAEVWWESVESMAAATATAEGREAGRALLEDERRFIDLERSALWVAREHEIVSSQARPAHETEDS